MMNSAIILFYVETTSSGNMHVANMKTRRHARYSPPEGTVAALKPYGEEFGLIKNIGEGGLAFERLIFNPREENVPTEPKKRIDVFCPKNKVYLSGIRCKIVWENGVPVNPKPNLSPFSFLPCEIDDVTIEVYPVKLLQHLFIWGVFHRGELYASNMSPIT